MAKTMASSNILQSRLRWLNLEEGIQEARIPVIPTMIIGYYGNSNAARNLLKGKACK